MTHETKNPDIELGVTMKGFYRCVLNEGTDREVDTGWFPNLITNAGLDQLANASPQIFNYASIGTGTNLPANTDSGLQAYTAHTQVQGDLVQANSGAPTYSTSGQYQHIYAQGAVVGNMAEVGLGWAAGGTGLWSRARILDGGGTPTILTVTAIDQLSTYYKLVVTPATTDISGTVTLSGTNYAYTGRLALAASFLDSFPQIYNITRMDSVIAYASASTLGAITGYPSGAQLPSGNRVNAPYTAGNRYLDATVTYLPAEGNGAGGIGTILFSYAVGRAYFQYSFTPAIPKDNTKTLTLVARISWNRA